MQKICRVCRVCKDAREIREVLELVWKEPSNTLEVLNEPLIMDREIFFFGVTILFFLCKYVTHTFKYSKQIKKLKKWAFLIFKC